jgi:hypothetical protein
MFACIHPRTFVYSISFIKCSIRYRGGLVLLHVWGAIIFSCAWMYCCCRNLRYLSLLFHISTFIRCLCLNNNDFLQHGRPLQRWVGFVSMWLSSISSPQHHHSINKCSFMGLCIVIATTMCLCAMKCCDIR